MAVTWPKVRTVTLDWPGAPLRWTMPLLSEATATGDPGSTLVSAVQTPSDITFTVDATVVAADPGSAAWWIWPLLDPYSGQQLNIADVFFIRMLIQEVSSAAAGRNMYVVMGVCNESDLNSGTVDALGGGTQYRAAPAYRTGLITSIANGANANIIDGNGVSAPGMVVDFNRQGTMWRGAGAQGIDGSGNQVNSNISLALPAALSSGPAFLYLAVGNLTAPGGAPTTSSQVIPSYHLTGRMRDTWVI